MHACTPLSRRALLVGASQIAGATLAGASTAPVMLTALDQFSLVRCGGRWWLVGELVVAAAGEKPVALRELRAAPGDMAPPLCVLPADALRAAGATRQGRPLERAIVAPGDTATLFLWHAIDGAPPTGPGVQLRLVTDAGEATLEVPLQRPTVLQPPLRGGPWVAVYDPLFPFGHRRSAFERDGRRHIPARFAVDWIRLDASGRPAPDGAGFDRWFGLGADVFAVADATVAAARDGAPDVLETLRPAGRWAPEEVAGNFVCLDIGGGRFVFYEHLKCGSVRVSAGQAVKAGQGIGQVGRSGVNSSGPHLHFHVADGPSLLHAQGRPWSLEGFHLLGDYPGMEAAESGRPWRPAAVAAGSGAPALPPPNGVLQFG